MTKAEERQGLFGEKVNMNVEDRRHEGTSPYIRFKKANRYRQEAKNKCHDCKHLTGHNHNGRNYYKCALMGSSRSAATDIRLSYGCDKWEEDDDQS